MNARNIGGNAKHGVSTTGKAHRQRRVKKTARLRTAVGSLGNRNFRNVRRGRRNL